MSYSKAASMNNRSIKTSLFSKNNTRFTFLEELFIFFLLSLSVSLLDNSNQSKPIS